MYCLVFRVTVSARGEVLQRIISIDSGLHRVCALLILVLLLAGCSAQHNVASGSPSTATHGRADAERDCARYDAAPAALRARDGYVQVTVTVTNSSDDPVRSLAEDDFKLYVNEQPIPIVFFRKDLDSPVSVGLVTDTSGSMFSFLPRMRDALQQFVGELDDRDDVLLIAFADRPYLLSGFTTDHAAVVQRMGIFRAQGRTALNDTILDALQTMKGGCYDRRAVVVVSDGDDTASRSDPERLTDMVNRSPDLIYTIRLAEPESQNRIGLGSLQPPEQPDAVALASLSRETGAKSFLVQKSEKRDELLKACKQISRELKSQYTIGFVADAPASGYRPVRLEIPAHPEMKVRARPGIVPPLQGASANQPSLQ